MSRRLARPVAFGLAIVATSIRPGAARAQDEATFTAPLPSFAADTFTLTYAGNLSALPAQVAGDTATDPFALAGGSPSISVVFNSGPDTTSVIFSGNAIGPGTSVTTGPVTFGVDGGTALPGGFALEGAAWSNSMTSSSQVVPVAGITIIPPPPAPVPPTFFFYIQVINPDGSVTEYIENPNDPNNPWKVSDDLTSPYTIVSAGYFFSPTQIPLDELNPGFLPPPGAPGSPFIPLPSLDGVTLQPGQSITVPEPSSLVALATGLAVAYGWRRRHGRGASRASSRLDVDVPQRVG